MLQPGNARSILSYKSYKEMLSVYMKITLDKIILVQHKTLCQTINNVKMEKIDYYSYVPNKNITILWCSLDSHDSKITLI